MDKMIRQSIPERSMGGSKWTGLSGQMCLYSGIMERINGHVCVGKGTKMFG